MNHALTRADESRQYRCSSHCCVLCSHRRFLAIDIAHICCPQSRLECVYDHRSLTFDRYRRTPQDEIYGAILRNAMRTQDRVETQQAATSTVRSRSHHDVCIL
jgi:hypothetical protein